MNKAIIDVTEPSIGQVEYLRYLQVMSKIQKPTFVLVELKLSTVDTAILDKTVYYFLRRHESMRTVFPTIDHEIKQAVLQDIDETFQVSYLDLRNQNAHTSEIRKAYIEQSAEEFANHEHGPLVKFLLFTMDNGYILSVVIHHILCDTWSCRIIREELISIYKAFELGQQPTLSPITFTLKDYCISQNSWLRKHRRLLITTWKQKLKGFDKMFDMSVFRKAYAYRNGKSYSNNRGQYSFTSGELSAVLDRPDSASYTRLISGRVFDELKQLTTFTGGTLPTTLYASLFLFLYAYTGKRKSLIPALIADRFIASYQPVIGCLLGSIYFAIDINDHKTIGDFFRYVDTEAMSLISQRQLIFSHSFLGLNGDAIRNCCDMYINYYISDQPVPHESQLSDGHTDGGAIHYPVYCTVIEYKETLTISWQYNKYLFEAKMIEDMAKCYEEQLSYLAVNTDKRVAGLKNLFHIQTIL